MSSKSAEPEEKPATVEHVDMPGEMQTECINAARAAMAEKKVEKDIAAIVKRNLDEKLGGTWHVVVGESFGCSVTHETKYIIFFKFGLMHFLIFRSLDEEPAFDA